MIGVQKLIDTYWVLFKEDDVECMCKGRKKCPKEKKPQCKEYVVKFIEVDRTAEEAGKELKKKIKISISELEKSFKKIKGFKL